MTMPTQPWRPAPRVATTRACTRCHQPIRPGTLYFPRLTGPTHVGKCPDGLFTAARATHPAGRS